MALNQPSLIPEPWASQGSHTTIPDTTSESGRASWAQGFPPETALPLGSGGVPPHWLDFQGVLHALSNHAVFKQSGGRYAWSASLDYPVGACIIGSNNRVYQALQNSGPGYAAGAKNPTTSGNSAYWGVLATPDGSSIVVNGSGKLAVSATNLADQLADGTTITASGGKLTAVNQSGDADALADGETIVASGGKLKVNYGAGLNYDPQTGKLIVVFNDLTADQILALCKPNGGISADSAGLYVDFSQIDDATKAEIISSLDMQVPLKATKTVYVNGTTGSDAGYDNDFANRDLENPGKFKSIRAAVKFLTLKFAFGTHNGVIRVEAGTYSESITLPQFTRTSGTITICADDYTQPPVITNSSAVSNIFYVEGAGWELVRLSIHGTRTDPDNGLENFACIFYISGGSLDVRGCSIIDEYTSPAAPQSGNVYLRTCYLENGALLRFRAMETYQNSMVVHKGLSTYLDVLSVGTASGVEVRGSNSDYPVEIQFYGEYRNFAAVSSSATFRYVGGSLHTGYFAVPSGQTADGKQYSVSRGGGIDVGSRTLPGDEAGTADATTYGWYVGG